LAVEQGQNVPAQEVTNFAGFYSLPREQAEKGVPIRVKGTVLCYDLEFGQMFVHDGAESQYFDPRAFPGKPGVSEYVEITARSGFGGKGLALTNLSLRELGRTNLPAAKTLGVSALASDQGQWVETSGQVRAAEISRGRLALVVEDQGRDCHVFVMGPPAANDCKRWVGCKVRVRGINTSKLQEGRLESAELMAPGLEDVRIEGGTSLDLATMPVVSIDALLSRELGDWTNRPVHINGILSAYKPGQYLVVKGPSGAIRAEITQVDETQLDQRVDVWGYLAVSPGEAFLRYGCFEVARPALGSVEASFAGAPGAEKSANSRVLTRIGEIAGLKPQEAAQGLPVRVRGVLTYADSGWRSGFIQNGKDAVFVSLSQADARAGDWVEVTGQTEPGRFRPQVRASAIEVMGRTNLPATVAVDLQDLATGALDARWVEMEGVVRRVNFEEGHAQLSVMTRQGRFRATVPGLEQGQAPSHLVDALISVRGACVSELNGRGQLSGITLCVPGLDQIRVLESVGTNAFEAPSTPIGSVAAFDPERLAGRRVKISGTVTALAPGEGFFLQDSSGGIQVETPEERGVGPGDRVEVLGSPRLGNFSPCLEEVNYRRVGTGLLPAARKTTAERILARGTEDATVVELEARLLQPVARSARPRLLLQDGPITFTAQFRTWIAARELPDFRPGSVLRLKGVCSIQGNESREPEGFRLLLSGPKDVVLVMAAPWWTPRHTLLLAGGFVLALVLALGWVASLRRQVYAQTELIRQRLKEGARLAESLAREKSLLATLFDHLPEMVFIKDLQARFVLTNRAHMEFYGLSQAELLGKSGHDLMPAEMARRFQEADDRILNGGLAKFEAEEPAMNRDGDLRWLAVTKVPLKEDTGKVIGLVGMARDTTESKEVQKELVETSRRAGKAEVASSVLHNVGNVLNSVNVSARLLVEQLNTSKLPNLARAAGLINEHSADLAQFLTGDAKGRRLPAYLAELSARLAEERQALLKEVHSLSGNIEHVKEIIRMQQGYARAMGTAETVRAMDLVEDALRMNADVLTACYIRISREYDPGVPSLTVEKHKVLQVLVNLIRNARFACDDSGRAEKRLTVKVANGGDKVRISVCDNGVGIPAENLTRIFNHGFTTRKDGHGFGLHSGALAAKELGGALLAKSDGLGHGATFTLELPVQRP